MPEQKVVDADYILLEAQGGASLSQVPRLWQKW